ncbi:MAG: 30S ribosomal protein THX [Pyrinomonadaceae bacterium]
MGRGDKKTKRGKIFAGSHGKARPKPKAAKKQKVENKSEKKETK